MSSVVIAGNTSGSVTLQAPDVAGTTVLNLPSGDATIVTSANVNDYASSFPSGTRLAFQQTSAPTGWTKDTTAGLNDSVMRIVTGTASSGGSSGWSAASIGATTLDTSQIPSHTHNMTFYLSGIAGSFGTSSRNSSGVTQTSTSSGGGGSHTHSFPSIKYYDFIIASKD